eukprot:CAMPEP_0197026772 /NCGR_PEP_ID=MMETSP1384-20130603/6801_1 /TAXON_ID=29189 /ORGANISM="Ammonia sp." /LENGTH=266 /DNA_ID=CAMNT_0042455501 /DNA_START=49 /DNA_END=850 /DNA_ORIENTATION=+
METVVSSPEASPRTAGSETKSGRSRTYDDVVAHLDQLFQGSTHRYIIYFGHTKDLNGLIIAFAVLSLQWLLFSMMNGEAVRTANGNDTVPLVVEISDYCQHNGTLVSSKFTSFTDFTKNVECHWSENNVFDHFEVVMLGYTLLAFYLMGDVIQAIKAFFVVPGCWSKLGALLVIFTGGYAGWTGSLFAYSGSLGGSSFEALGNCIGVLFITDFDEKIYQALEHVRFGDKLKDAAAAFAANAVINALRSSAFVSAPPSLSSLESVPP